MKIAYFLGTLKVEDGVTRVILALIREGQKKGVQSIIVTGYAEDPSISPVPIIQVPSFAFPLYKEYKLALPGTQGFKESLDEFGPDVIYIHSPDTIAWAALRYSKKNKIPIIASYHTHFGKYLPYYYLSSLNQIVWSSLSRLYKQMNFVTAPSKEAGQDIIDHGVSNVYAIPWGVELENFNPSFCQEEWRNKILNKKDGNIILCVCRLVWYKDLITLSRVFNKLKENKKDFTMVIAGDGPARSDLESLMPGAIFLGHIECEELSKVYASSDIFLFPSTTETFGNVTIEAMASGLVSVVANAGGSNSLIRNKENGFLAKPKDVNDFYEKVCLLLDNKELREKMKKTGLEIAQNYTWSKVFDEIYQKLLH